MDNLLKTLKEHLVVMVEEIDNYTHANSGDIIIKKEDFKYLNHLELNNNYGHVFEYKSGIKFTLFSNSQTSLYKSVIYSALMDGSLEVLILNKRDDFEVGKHVINYSLETEIKTNLRNLYRPIKEDD